MKSGILVTLCLALVTAACAPAGPAVDMAAETEALREAAAGYDAAVQALDAAGMAKYYASDARSMPPNTPTLTGPAEMQGFVEEVAAMEGVALSLDAPEIFVSAAGDIGYTVGTVRITMPGPDGQPATTSERDVHVWRKDADGSWKIVIDIWNSEEPLPETGESE